MAGELLVIVVAGGVGPGEQAGGEHPAEKNEAEAGARVAEEAAHWS